MLESEGIIVAEKRQAVSSIVIGAVWLTFVVITFWTLTKLIGTLDIDTIAQRDLFKLVMVIAVVGASFTFYFSVEKTYKVDLINNRLTVRSHFPFWTNEKTDIIETKEITNIEDGRTTVSSKNIHVAINRRKIRIYVDLHPSEVDAKINYLRKYGFRN